MILEDFYAEVLQKLGVLAAEESPTAADKAEVVAKYQQVHEELTRRDQLSFFNDEDVDEWCADALATIVAFRLAMVFSMPQDTRLELRADAAAALDHIIGDGQRRTFDDVPVEYF